MPDVESFPHTRWECRYDVVFIPKYRKKALFGKLRQHPGEVFRARGFMVSTVGKYEAAVRQYIKNQEQEDRRFDQLKLL